MANQTGAIVAKPQYSVAIFEYRLVELWGALVASRCLWREGGERHTVEFVEALDSGSPDKALAILKYVENGIVRKAIINGQVMKNGLVPFYRVSFTEQKESRDDNRQKDSLKIKDLGSTLFPTDRGVLNGVL